MPTLYVGIDSSVHSTGLVIRTKDNSFLKLYQITSSNIKCSPSVNQVVYKHLSTNTKDYTNDDLNKLRNGMSLGRKIIELIERAKQLSGAESVRIAMEGSVMSFGFKGNQSRVNDLIAYNSCIKLCVMQFNKTSFDIFAPTQVKKIFVGKGNAKKQMMIDKFKTLFPMYDTSVGKNDDISDAYALSCCAMNKHPDEC